MGIKSCLHLLIVSMVVGQGIAVPLEENREASSALLIRQKRASSSSGQIPVNSSPARPNRGVGFAPPNPWVGPLLPGMIRIYHGTNEIGIGVVLKTEPSIIAAKAHIFPKKLYAGEYHVKYNDNNGQIVRSYIETVKPYKYYIKNEEPWGPNDMCLVYTDLGPQKSRHVLTVLMATRLFTREQMKWLGTKMGIL